jgi:hypothetical protein
LFVAPILLIISNNLYTINSSNHNGGGNRMIQIEEIEGKYVVFMTGEEIGRFGTEKEAKEFAIAQTEYPILEE